MIVVKQKMMADERISAETKIVLYIEHRAAKGDFCRAM